MALDIARVLRYARLDGTLALSPQRHHLAFIDGIVGGESEGPVYPDPVHTGCVLFGSNPLVADYVAALLIGFNPQAIPLISQGTAGAPYAAADEAADRADVSINGTPCSPSDASRILSRPFQPPKGWRQHVEA
jgi:uncharacterized protein (DUF362 family)